MNNTTVILANSMFWIGLLMSILGFQRLILGGYCGNALSLSNPALSASLGLLMQIMSVILLSIYAGDSHY